MHGTWVSALAMLVAISSAALAPAAARAQAYPDRAIHIVIPFAAGGGTDIYTRLLATALSGQLGQPVVVENVSGASGLLALERIAKAPKDGYSLLVVTSSNISAAPHLYRKLPFKVDDFAPVALVARFPFYLFATPGLPANGWKEFVAYAKANPGKVSYATSGIGSTPHLLGEMIKKAAGIEMVDVPYKGSGPAQADLMAGHVQVYVDIPSPGLSFVRSGKLKALVVLDDKRTNAAPEVPSIAEMGHPDVTAGNRYSLLVPSGTPKAIIDRLNGAAIAGMKSGPLYDRQAADDAVPGPVTPEQLGAMLKADYETWGAVARRLGVKLD